MHLEASAFGLVDYCINASRVNPYREFTSETEKALSDVFDASPRVLSDLKKNGKDSKYLRAKCSATGTTGVHACSINGDLALLAALVEAGGRPFDKGIGGKDCEWMARRRGHRRVLAYLQTVEKPPPITEVVEGERQRAERLRADQISVGARVYYRSPRRLGVVRYIGCVDYARGVMVGVELDEPTGKHNGTVKGRFYFECPQSTGIFCQPSDLELVDGTKLPVVDDFRPAPQPILSYL